MQYGGILVHHIEAMITPPTHRYRVLFTLDVETDLKDHLCPLELVKELRAEADHIERTVDDYISFGGENSPFITLVSETPMGNEP